MRDPELRYEWMEDSLIARNISIDCGFGSLVVEVIMNDGSALDESIFKLEEQALIVRYSENTELQGLYKLKLRAYYDGLPERYLTKSF